MALFLSTHGVVQYRIALYRLGGTADAQLRQSPIKLVFETARELLRARRADILHLGGGAGGRHDSLFGFKAGLSRHRHPEIHDHLCRARGRDPAEPVGARFFPLYREP